MGVNEMTRVAERLEMRHAGGGSAVAPHLTGVLLSETEAWRGVWHTVGIQYTGACAAACCKGGQLECAVRDVYQGKGLMEEGAIASARGAGETLG